MGKPIDDTRYFGQGVGIAVKRGNQSLFGCLNKALGDIKANETYTAIVQKYFGNQR